MFNWVLPTILIDSKSRLSAYTPYDQEKLEAKIIKYTMELYGAQTLTYWNIVNALPRRLWKAKLQPAVCIAYRSDYLFKNKQ